MNENQAKPAAKPAPVSKFVEEAKKMLGDKGLVPKTDKDVAADKIETAAAPDIMAPEELLKIRQEFEQSALMKEQRMRQGYLLPSLPTTEEDQNRFVESILSNEPYTEEFSRYGGKFKVRMRARMKTESDVILQQLIKDIEGGAIKAPADYVMQMNYYNLLFQVVAVNDVAFPPINPHAEDLDLRKELRESLFNTMPDPKMYILVSMLNQFDEKVLTLSRLALNPDFSSPAAAS